MHADDFRHDRYGVVSGLRDGGYSDDMTLAAIAGNEFMHLLILVLVRSRLSLNSTWNKFVLALAIIIDSSFSHPFLGAHKRLITSPPVAVFPHPLASDLSFSRFVTSHV